MANLEFEWALTFSGGNEQDQKEPLLVHILERLTNETGLKIQEDEDAAICTGQTKRVFLVGASQQSLELEAEHLDLLKPCMSV